jgi:hypothetical protein
MNAQRTSIEIIISSKPSTGSPFGIEPQGFKPLKTQDLQKRVFHILSKPHLYIEVYKAGLGILRKHDRPTQPYTIGDTFINSICQRTWCLRRLALIERNPSTGCLSAHVRGLAAFLSIMYFILYLTITWTERSRLCSTYLIICLPQLFYSCSI